MITAEQSEQMQLCQAMQIRSKATSCKAVYRSVRGAINYRRATASLGGK